MKKRYEVALMESVVNSVADDFESIEFIDADTYNKAVEVAKIESLKWDACDVICYVSTSETDYWQLWRETYVSGKKTRRIEF